MKDCELAGFVGAASLFCLLDFSGAVGNLASGYFAGFEVFQAVAAFLLFFWGCSIRAKGPLEYPT